jgi:transcriptional antiterminator RfaH
MSDYSSQTAGWFCVQTVPKHEHIAAACLRQYSDVNVFLPRIRFQRPTKFGPIWITEALFLNYLFARFDLSSCVRRIRAARGVRNVVHFGAEWPCIPDDVIAQLQQAFGQNEVSVVSRDFKAGDLVEIAGGAFCGLQAVVSHAIPAKQRVAILLDFLGRQMTVELDYAALVGDVDVRTKADMSVIRPDLIAA